MGNWWVSWYEHGSRKNGDFESGVAFELHTPWWISGERLDGQTTIVAAVKARNEAEAKRVVLRAHDKPVRLNWRFVNARPDDWSPFCDRFTRAKWMQWPATHKEPKKR